MTVARSGCTLALLTLCLAAGTSGQTISSPYRFIETNQYGGIFGGSLSAGGSTVGLAPRDGEIGGLRYGIRLSGPFNAEFDAAYLRSTRTVQDTIVVDSAFQAAGEAEVGLAVVNAALRFNLTGGRTWHRLQPYASFGVGVAIDVLGENGADEELPADARFHFGTSFAGQLGGGIEWFATDRLTIRLDARNALWKVKTPAPFLKPGLARRTPADEWVQNGIFSLGLALHF